MEITLLIMANHGIVFLNFCGNPDVYLYVTVGAFPIYLSVVKIRLKEEVGGHALKSHGNYVVDNGKIMELCF